MIVYHGSTVAVQFPDIEHSFRNLDFGKGFYVTPILQQAERWAKRKAFLMGQDTSIINQYEMMDNWDNFNTKIFSDTDIHEWLDFVCDCRNGGKEYQQFDIIRGKVADDKVFRVVNMYIKGIFDKQRTLKELKVYDNYEQIAFISQKSIVQLLTFQKTIQVSL